MGVAVAGIGAVTSIAKIAQGRKQTALANQLQSEFEFQELTNPAESIAISTLGTDLQREQANLALATGVQALQQGGTRGIGQLGNLQAQQNQVNQQIAQNLEQQDIRRQYAVAQGNERVQNIQEQRDNQRLQGIGQLLNVGNQTQNQGFADLLNTAGYASQLQQGASGGTTTGGDVGTVANGAGVVGQPMAQNPAGSPQFSQQQQGFGSLGSGINNPTNDYLAQLGIL